MNQKVQECLEKLQAAEKSKQQQEKEKVLTDLGLCYYKPAEKEYKGPICEYNDKKEYGRWIKVYEEVSDEEYQELLKHYPPASEVIYEDFDCNTEKNLQKISFYLLVLVFVVYIIAFIISFINRYITGATILAGVLTLLSALIGYWTICVFTNISSRATKIHQILAAKEKK